MCVISYKYEEAAVESWLAEGKDPVILHIVKIWHILIFCVVEFCY